MAVSVSTSVSSVSDSAIQPFLQRDFDPADYLNNTLPSLSLSTSSRAGQYGRTVPLPELSTQLNTLLSQLNAQTSRLSNALTHLTDEIIRSGGRLAYEVEVLRGETTGLTDSLENGLSKDIELFKPTGSGPPLNDSDPNTSDAIVDKNTAVEHTNPEPEYLRNLQTLTDVRSKLDTVKKVFGDAMLWPLAPSELSLASSLISVSAPDTSDDSRSREEKGKAYAEALRVEIDELMGSGNNFAGLEAAAVRIEELRRLAEVWKGTAEEKARMRLVEGLLKPVEERQRALERTSGGRRANASPSRGVDYRYGGLETSRAAGEGGYGFLQNLRALKNELYLE